MQGKSRNILRYGNKIIFRLNLNVPPPPSEMQINTRVCIYLSVFIFVHYSTSFERSVYSISFDVQLK